MLRRQLSEGGVAKLKAPAASHVDYFDTLLPGLILRAGYGGAKTWLVRHYLKRRTKAGKKVSVPTTHKIGRYPVLKVKEARDRARLFLADPIKAKTEADHGSFREVAANFIKRHVEAAGLRTRDQIEETLDNLIYPQWADRPFRDIKRGDVAELLDSIQDDHSARQADKALAVIRKMMNWYTTRNGDYSSPIVRGMGRYSTAEHKRKRILADDEIRMLWSACADAGTYGALLKVLLLTGQRKDKVATMRWADVHGAVWVIQTATREKSNAEVLRLPPMVMDIINARPRIAGNPYIFAGRAGPYNGFSVDKKNLDKKLVIPHWVNHDLRRTAKTLMVRSGIRPDISERVLGHAIVGVEGIYDQYDYSDEKADALIRLAARVEMIINPPPDNVKQLADARQQAKQKAAG
jgi:integrase